MYGRPLFQGLSYHDTPFAPLPQMMHVDTSAKAGVQARLHCDCLEQRGRAVGTLLGGNHSMNARAGIRSNRSAHQEKALYCESSMGFASDSNKKR